jgi:hypothetical protein
MALSASSNIMERYHPAAQRYEAVLGSDSTQYFKGGLVGVQASDGKLVKLTNASTVNAVFICDEEVLTGTSNTRKIKVRTGIFKLLNGDSIAVADIGKVARVGAAGDDSAFKGGADGTEAVIGRIENVDSASDPGGAGVWVRIFGYDTIVNTATGAAVNTGS